MTREDRTDYSEYHAALEQFGVENENEFNVTINSIELLSFKLHHYKLWRFFAMRRIQQTLIPKGFKGEVLVEPGQPIALKPYLRTTQEEQAWKAFSESVNVEELLEEINVRAQQTTDHFIGYVVNPIAHAIERLVYESELASGISAVKGSGGTLKSTEDLLQWVDELHRFDRQAIRDRLTLRGPGRSEGFTERQLRESIQRHGATARLKDVAHELDINSRSLSRKIKEPEYNFLAWKDAVKHYTSALNSG